MGPFIVTLKTRQRKCHQQVTQMRSCQTSARGLIDHRIQQGPCLGDFVVEYVLIGLRNRKYLLLLPTVSRPGR